MGKITILMGPSSSGKDTIFKGLMKDNPYHLQTIIPSTTRPPRVGETEGVSYYFKTIEQMEEMKRQKQIIESRVYETRHGLWYYFTSNQNIDLDSHNYATINTLNGYDQFCEFYGKENIIPIYIALDPGIRLEQEIQKEIKQEKPDYQQMCRRFLKDQEEFSLDNLKKRNIENIIDNSGTVESSVLEIHKILQKQL